MQTLQRTFDYTNEAIKEYASQEILQSYSSYCGIIRGVGKSTRKLFTIFNILLQKLRGQNFKQTFLTL